MAFTALVIVSIILTALAAIAGAIYISGAADDVVEWLTTKFLVYKAKAEEKALEKAGTEGAQNFLKSEWCMLSGRGDGDCFLVSLG